MGYNTQKMAVGNTSYDGLGVDSRFIYAVSAKSSVDFGLNDDFSYDALGSAFRTVAPFIGFTSALDPQWSVNGQLSYGRYSYLTQARKDDCKDSCHRVDASIFTTRVGGTGRRCTCHRLRCCPDDQVEGVEV